MYLALVVDDEMGSRKVAKNLIIKYCNPALTHKNADPEALKKLHPFGGQIEADTCDSHDAAIAFFERNFRSIKVIVMDYNLGKGQTGVSVLTHMRAILAKADIAENAFPYVIPNSSDSNLMLCAAWPADRVLPLSIKPEVRTEVRAEPRRSSFASAPDSLPFSSSPISSSYEAASDLLAAAPLARTTRSHSACPGSQERNEEWQPITIIEEAAGPATPSLAHLRLTPIPMSAIPLLSISEATPSNSPRP